MTDDQKKNGPHPKKEPDAIPDKAVGSDPSPDKAPDPEDSTQPQESPDPSESSPEIESTEESPVIIAPAGNGGLGGNGSAPFKKYPKTTIAIMGVLMLLVVVTLLSIMVWPDQTVVPHLRDPNYARGLITFLFTLGTIVIAIILTLYAVLRRPGEDIRNFTHAKEIFTVLVGILGTIIGFYFGTIGTDTEGPEPSESPMELAASLSESEVQEDTQVTVMAFGKGGQPPYVYSLTFEPSTLSDVADLQSTGWLVHTLNLVQVDQDTELSITVTLSDQAGAEIADILELRVKNVPNE